MNSFATKTRRLWHLFPRWCFVALAADVLLFFVMVWYAKSVCTSQSCYYIKFEVDRLADYLALIVAVMAILIPIAIELWKEQLQTHNLSQKSVLDQAWAERTRRRYLNEPLGSIAIFAVLCTLIPLMVRSSALFYADVFYGLYVLFYMLLVAFYARPINVYADIDDINPHGTALPNLDMMLELVQSTARLPKQDVDIKNEIHTGPVWVAQLSEEQTLNTLGKWLNKVLTTNSNDIVNKSYSWMLMNSFLQKCDVMLIWRSIDVGVLKDIAQKEKFYTADAHHAGQIIWTIVRRLAADDAANDMIRNLFQLVPVQQLGHGDTLQTIFSSAFKELFLKSGDVTYLLEDAFPPEWQVTNAGLAGSNKMVRVTASTYLNWIRDRQTYAQTLNERAVQATTEFIFPEVETIMFAKFVLLWLNTGHILASSPEGVAAFQDSIDRWQLFGRVSRVRSGFTPVSDDGHEIERAFFESMENDRVATIQLVKNIGMIPKDRATLEDLSHKLIDAIGRLTWSSDNYKQTWVSFAEMLPQLAGEDES